MHFLEFPNLPANKVKRVIVDYRTDYKIINSLEKKNIKVYLTCEMRNLSFAVKGHADMSICHVGGNRFICEPSAYEYYINTLNIDGIEIIKGSSTLESTYPHDIAYNIAWISSNKIIHMSKYTDIFVKSNVNNVAIIDTKQGYSKCNVCVVSDNAIITSDESIYRNALKNEIDALKISNGNISLNGYEYGFIGGATGLISNDTLALTGNVHLLPECDKIIDFCRKYNVKIESLSNDMPVDIGSIIPISYD